MRQLQNYWQANVREGDRNIHKLLAHIEVIEYYLGKVENHFLKRQRSDEESGPFFNDSKDDLISKSTD